jgi:hypothetical protein
MEKFLFTDGITGVKEAQSVEDLENLIESAEQPGKIRIWIFSSNEWISLNAYRKLYPALTKRERAAAVPVDTRVAPARKSHLAKKALYLVATATGIFLVFNFTKVNWETAEPLRSSATRPANMPEMDIDSLITVIEDDRSKLLDRSTRTNLRLRNTWPDRILLQVGASREKSSAGSRFFDVNISVDNTTGFPIDKAVVRLLVWKNKKSSVVDTFHFNTIRYEKLASRQTDMRYRGDSISVDFESIRAKSFNFCYSETTKNEPGSHNDRWFCRDQ